MPLRFSCRELGPIYSTISSSMGEVSRAILKWLITFWGFDLSPQLMVSQYGKMEVNEMKRKNLTTSNLQPGNLTRLLCSVNAALPVVPTVINSHRYFKRLSPMLSCQLHWLSFSYSTFSDKLICLHHKFLLFPSWNTNIPFGSSCDTLTWTWYSFL